MSREILEAMTALAREKGISEEKLRLALEDALLSAYKKQPGAAKYARVELDPDTADYRVIELIIPERLEAHRANAACASCHAVMDPPGLSLERFDAVGRWRDLDETYAPIDTSGVLPDGTKYNGVAGLRQALLGRSDLFVRTLTEKLLTYALGRGLEFYDAPAVRAIVRSATADQSRFSSLILAIVDSAPFQMRRASDS